MAATLDPVPISTQALLTEHGSAIGSFGYLVLQNQTDAERILAATLAAALSAGDRPMSSEAARLWLLRIAARQILRGSLRSGEVQPLLPDPRSASDRMTILAGLAELDPRSRMAIVLHFLLRLPPDEVARVLDDDPIALRSDLHDARNRLQARVDDDPEAAGRGVREPFDSRLASTLVEEATRFKPIVDVARLRLPASHPRHLRRGWWLLTVVGLLVGAVGAFFWLVPESPPIEGQRSTASRAAAPSVQPADAPITLADCHIAPADSPLAFAGWTTLAALDVRGGRASPDQPIYALVTRGLAEWVGWQKPYTGPMLPAPVGRMGCIFDPSSRESSLIGVDRGWEPDLKLIADAHQGALCTMHNICRHPMASPG